MAETPEQRVRVYMSQMMKLMMRLCRMRPQSILLLIIIMVCTPVITTTISNTTTDSHPFTVTWNAPTDNCKSKYNVTVDTQSYNILANKDHTFYGDKVVLFYEHELGLYPKIERVGSKMVLKNGGVPQATVMSSHLYHMTSHIQAAIPDPQYNGLAVIDYEAWSPLWTGNWGDRIVYKHHSISLVTARHRDWPRDKITKQAIYEFEKGAKDLMLKTIQYAKMLRPNAQWGYYGFPICSTGLTASGTCSATYQQINDKLDWMFDASDALYPSIYLKDRMLNHPQEDRHAYIQAKLRETKRVQSSRQPQALYAYTTYAYDLYVDVFTFYDKADLCSSIKQVADAGFAGVVLWGSWASASTAHRCQQIADNLSDLLGPYALLVQDMSSKCAITKCHSHGRCGVEFGSECHTLTPLPVYECQCDRSFMPPDCAHKIVDYFKMGFSLGQLYRQGVGDSNALQHIQDTFLNDDDELAKYL